MARNVIPMNPNLTQNQTAGKDSKLPRRRHLGIILIGAMLLFALASVSLVNAYQGLQKQVKIEQQAVKQNASLDNAASMKQSEIAKLKDPNFLEKYARARYNYSKSGEKVFSAPDLVEGGITP